MATPSLHIYAVQILFVLGICFGSQNLNFETKDTWVVLIARYLAYLIVVWTSQELSLLVYELLSKRHLEGLSQKLIDIKSKAVLFATAAAIVYYSKQKLIGEDFLALFIAYLIVQFSNMGNKCNSQISYGVGMACSFFEGYLVHVLPSDGAQFVGFLENISIFENEQGVVFPVRKLFIIITKSLYCPPDLKHFNKENRDDLPKLEACRSLRDVEKDVAGVKGRTYRNSAYKITRRGKAPVYLAAECATPLHTLHRVLQNKTLYTELDSINKCEVVDDFCRTLTSIIAKSHECKDKCELVYFDDTDPKVNLADVLLDKIRAIVPDFENVKRN